MGFLREMFGPSRSEVWKQLSDQVGGSYVPGGFLHSDKVVAKVDAWTVTLDTYAEPVGRATVTYTRIRAPYVNHDGFRFLIYERGLLSEFGKRLGMQDIEIGDAAFDAKFIIQGNDAAKLHALFADTTLRDLINRQPSVHLEVKDDEGWFGDDFPQGIDELYFQTVGVMRDLTHLNEMYTLFAETLHQLCRIGSAYENEPPIIGRSA